MSKFPLIDKGKIFCDSPDGIVLSDEASEWLENVLDTLNFMLQTGVTRRERDRENLARLILAINRESTGCSGGRKA